MASRDNKIIILKAIEARKEVLFGKFCDKLTKSDKSRAWQEIYNVGKSVSAFEDKQWTYIRDVFWPNARRVTMQKVDNAKKTGTAGGKDAKFTDIDNKVLDIIGGKDSPLVSALDVPESFEIATTSATAESENLLDMGNKGGIQFLSNKESNDGVSTPKSLEIRQSGSDGKVTKRLLTKKVDNDELAVLKKQKIKLQIDYLKLKNRKMALEVLQLEQSLGFPCSEAVAEYYPNNVIVVENSIDSNVSIGDNNSNGD